MKTLIIIAFVLSISITAGVYITNSIIFKRSCSGYLKQAADANSIEMAKTQLHKAIVYMEENKLTEGYTSVWYDTQEDDISFWYNNLKSAESELNTIGANASQLEKSNVLIKLRETLLDQDKNGEHVTVPNGISRYPHNGIIGAFVFITVILGFCLIVIFHNQ